MKLTHFALYMTQSLQGQTGKQTFLVFRETIVGFKWVPESLIRSLLHLSWQYLYLLKQLYLIEDP